MTVKYCAKCKKDGSGMCNKCAAELLEELNNAPELPVKMTELELLKIEYSKLLAENETLKTIATEFAEELDYIAFSEYNDDSNQSKARLTEIIKDAK